MPMIVLAFFWRSAATCWQLQLVLTQFPAHHYVFLTVLASDGNMLYIVVEFHPQHAFLTVLLQIS